MRKATNVIALFFILAIGVIWISAVFLFNLALLGIADPISQPLLVLSLLLETAGPVCLMFAGVQGFRGKIDLKYRLTLAVGALELSAIAIWTIWGTLHDAADVIPPVPWFYALLLVPTVLCDLSAFG